MGKNEKKKKLSVLYFHQIGGPIMFGNIGALQARHPTHEYHSSFLPPSESIHEYP
jgi:hypothetical protein